MHNSLAVRFIAELARAVAASLDDEALDSWPSGAGLPPPYRPVAGTGHSCRALRVSVQAGGETAPGSWMQSSPTSGPDCSV